MSKNLAQKKELQNNINNEFVLFVQYYDYTTSNTAKAGTSLSEPVTWQRTPYSSITYDG